ncbi:restriction endonuclease [Streptomyces bluensis]|uniref:Restriction endonuclease n=1 Tax=Streptomyces bluensis TaxID=33897 RepID=A0ABW6UAQ3_9ACTN
MAGEAASTAVTAGLRSRSGRPAIRPARPGRVRTGPPGRPLRRPGADVAAWDEDGRKIVAHCKQYTAPVGSGAVQKFNGTARPEHGADVAAIVALNGFTKPATEFAERHDIALIGRPELKRRAHGEHLYAVVDGQHSPT